MPRPATPRVTAPGSAHPRAARVWRVALLWQGTVLDVVTLTGARGKLTLRTGEVLQAQVVDGAIILRGAGEDPLVVEAGVVVQLAAGHAVLATEELPEAKAGLFTGIDATMFHATMIGAAFQACLVAALVLAPSPTFDPEAGAGLQGQYRRYLVAPGGTAETRGAASLSAVGRPPQEGEKLLPARSSGHRPRTMGGKALTLEQALNEMSRVLQHGNDGVELREAVGELAQSVARAPELGAGVGGLSPRDPIEVGSGNGLVGPGESRLAEELRQRIQNADKRAKMVFTTRGDTPIPVELLEIPEAHVTLAESSQLDPEVKAHLMEQVRERHNSVRYCYESWGLAADGTRAGKLTLEVTLRPDGRIDEPQVTVDNPALALVGECVQRMAAEWYLGGGLVEEPQRLSFPFLLRPRQG